MLKKAKSKDNKKNKNVWFETKKIFFGVSKEFKRISWPSLKHVLWAFLIVFILTGFLVLLFFIVGDILIASHVIDAVKKATSSVAST